MTLDEFLALPQWLREQLDAVAAEENVPPWAFNLDNHATAQAVGNLAFEEASGHEEKYDAYRKSFQEVMGS